MTQGTCAIAECERGAFSRQLCRPHYMTAYQAGELDRYPKVRASRRCRACGTDMTGRPRHRYCSTECRPAPGPRRAGVLRTAVETADHAGIIAAIRARCTVTTTGCWEWQGKRSSDDYPRVLIAGKEVAVHRMVLGAKEQAPLGSQQAHHRCANTMCVNPDHLQPVTHAENIAEMRARQSYLARIAELEDALRAVHPHHPVLRRAAYAA